MNALRSVALFCLLPAVALAAPTQATSPTHARTAASAATRVECTTAESLCVAVPAGWKRLGDLFGGLGFVAAEPATGVDSASWPQLTVAVLDAPTSKNGAVPSLGQLIEVLLAPDDSYQSETVERSRTMLNGAESETVRVRLRDANGAVSLEQMTLIQGEDNLFYSIALRCTPAEFARLEPVFQRAVHSWHVKAAAARKPQPTPEKKQ